MAESKSEKRQEIAASKPKYNIPVLRRYNSGVEHWDYVRIRPFPYWLYGANLMIRIFDELGGMTVEAYLAATPARRPRVVIMFPCVTSDEAGYIPDTHDDHEHFVHLLEEYLESQEPNEPNPHVPTPDPGTKDR